MLDGLTFALTTRRGRRCAGANLFWSILAAALSWTLCHTAFPAEAGTGVEEAEAERSRLFEQGLRLANLRPSDLAFGLLPDLEDSLRLARVDEVLEEGLRVDTWAERLAGELESCSRLQELVHRLRHELRRSGEAGWRPVEQRLGRHGARSFSRWLELLKELGRTRFRPAADLDSLERDLLELLREEEGLEHLDVFTLDSLERASRRQLEGRVERLSRAVLPDPGQLERVLGDIDRLFLDLPFFKAAALGRETWEHPLYGSVHYADELVVVGAEGENVYPGETPPLLIDLGGADRYTGPAARSRGTLSLVLDLGGDDVYSCEAEPGIASSVGGLSVLIDLAGDDRYRASSFALGAALGGTALLIDHEGEDLYEGDTFCLGAGSLGLGVLVDGAGRDLYSCSLYGQGFGHLAGLGLLQDNGGDDQFLMRPRYVDIIRYNDHHLTLGQGFGFGLRPHLSGGIGFLLDLGGNDLYSCDIYGQGSAYWYALGALVDRGGNDRYQAWQYAQGSGVHLAGAVLLDGAGDDVYFSRGVSQGCGHDLALGWLADDAGNDSYLAWDLSQAAGNANGIGLLSDLKGNDLYALRRSDNARGYGNPRRRSGSLGLFLDGAGEDHYLGPGAEDSLWRGSQRGFGADLGGSLLLELKEHGTGLEEESRTRLSDHIGAEETGIGWDPLFDHGDGVERLYVWAIRLEPKWSAERKRAREELLNRGVELLDYLEREGILGSRLSWERHAVKDLLLGLGEEALPLLRAALRDTVKEARSMALWVLGLEADVGGAELFLPLVADSEDHPPAVRAAALENLALRAGEVGPLLEGLDDPDPRVRRSAAWGLGRLPADDRHRLALLRILGDQSLAVRQAASQSLRGDSLLSAELLRSELSGMEGERLRRRELLRLLAELFPEDARKLLAQFPPEQELAVEEAWLRRELGLERADPAAGSNPEQGKQGNPAP